MTTKHKRLDPQREVILIGVAVRSKEWARSALGFSNVRIEHHLEELQLSGHVTDPLSPDPKTTPLGRAYLVETGIL